MGEDGNWSWIDVSDHVKHERVLRKFSLGVAAVVIVMLLSAFVLCLYARADERLPGGVTCEQIVRYASMLGIPNTHHGRAQAKSIANTLGLVVTDSQLDAAAECLRVASLKAR